MLNTPWRGWVGSSRGGPAARLAVFDEDKVEEGDSAQVSGPHHLAITADAESELVLVDVPLQFQPVGVWAGS